VNPTDVRKSLCKKPLLWVIAVIYFLQYISVYNTTYYYSISFSQHVSAVPGTSSGASNALKLLHCMAWPGSHITCECDIPLLKINGGVVHSSDIVWGLLVWIYLRSSTSVWRYCVMLVQLSSAICKGNITIIVNLFAWNKWYINATGCLNTLLLLWC
jgi:hypothetical protein